MSGGGRAGDEDAGVEAVAAAGRAEEEGGAGELVVVARVAKVRGVRGEVAADLLTDFPDRFKKLARLIAVDPTAGAREELRLEGSWLHGERVVLKFGGYDTPEASKALVGRELAVPEAEAVKLGPDEFYDWQLRGCRVETVGGDEVGVVRDVLHGAGDAPVLVIEGAGRREHLVPLAASICVRVDVGGKLIRVDPPEGLLE